MPLPVLVASAANLAVNIAQVTTLSWSYPLRLRCYLLLRLRPCNPHTHAITATCAAYHAPMHVQAAAPVKRSDLREALMLSIPTVFDLIATVLMNIGLLSVTASVYQMMRGAEMVFAAVLAITFLKRTLNRLHYSGISACIAGIVLVGLSSVLSGDGGSQIEASPPLPLTFSDNTGNCID